MVYIPPVNIPDLSQRQSYASQIYTGLSGVGDAFRQNRRDRVTDDQWSQNYARAIANDQRDQMNADRNYELAKAKFDADPSGGSDERWFGNKEPYQLPDGRWVQVITSNLGNWKFIDPQSNSVVSAGNGAPGGGVPGPDVASGAGGGMGGVVPGRNGYNGQNAGGALEISTGGTQVAQNGGFAPTGSRVVDTGFGAVLLDRAGNRVGMISYDAIQSGKYTLSRGPDGEVYATPTRGTQEALDVAGKERGLTQDQTKARAAVNMVESNADTLNGALDQMDQVMQSGWATGFPGWLGRNTTGAIGMETEGGKFAALADQIKSRIVQDTLQRVRELSPTGGAFGQVSDFENRLMAATQGPIDPNNPTLTAETLQNIRRAYAEYVAANRLAYMVDFEGLDPQTFSNALDAIRQGADPQAVVARAMGRR